MIQTRRKKYLHFYFHRARIVHMQIKKGNEGVQ